MCIRACCQLAALICTGIDKFDSDFVHHEHNISIKNTQQEYNAIIKFYQLIKLLYPLSSADNIGVSSDSLVPGVKVTS